MISGTIAGSNSFTVYPLGEIPIPRPYYISYISSTGDIYVPASLVNAYKSASRWKYYSAIIQPIPPTP